MLTNIGRAAVRRVGAGGSHASTNRGFQGIWRLHSTHAHSNVNNASDRTQFPLLTRRLYATTTKVTQTTAPRAKRVATTKAIAAKAKPKKAVKKPAVKKPKKRVASKPKPKPKRKVKAKKVISPEQKAKADIKALKVTALSPPKAKPSTAWTVLVNELGTEQAGTGKSATSFSKEAATKYRSLSPEQLEEYNHVANQNKVANTIALKEWTESHTPEQIRLANNARLLLKRKTGKTRSYSPLKDSRIPKRAVSGFVLFAADRWASGDFKGVKVGDSAPIIRREYLALSDVDRKVYEDRADADKERYVQEFKTVFRRDPEFIKRAATT